jgi:hypothetical protein
VHACRWLACLTRTNPAILNHNWKYLVDSSGVLDLHVNVPTTAQATANRNTWFCLSGWEKLREIRDRIGPRISHFVYDL